MKAWTIDYSRFSHIVPVQSFLHWHVNPYNPICDMHLAPFLHGLIEQASSPTYLADEKENN